MSKNITKKLHNILTNPVSDTETNEDVPLSKKKRVLKAGPKSKVKTKPVKKLMKTKPIQKKEGSLNVPLLSKNITQKLQNILAVPSDTPKNEEPSKKKKKKILNSPLKQKLVKKSLNRSPIKLKKKLKRLDSAKESKANVPIENTITKIQKVTGLNIANLKKQLAKSLEVGETQEETLRERMMDKLSGARFRYINEQLYMVDGSEAQKLFKSDPAAFEAYHEGYRNQVEKWPLNPLDAIITSVKTL